MMHERVLTVKPAAMLVDNVGERKLLFENIPVRAVVEVADQNAAQCPFAQDGVGQIAPDHRKFTEKPLSRAKGVNDRLDVTDFPLLSVAQLRDVRFGVKDHDLDPFGRVARYRQGHNNQ